jgi:signal transduction histidine kinase
MMRDTRTVLLVEDHDADAVLFRLLLEECGAAWQVEHVTRLADAVERLPRGGIDVIALDLNLPDAFGADTVARLRLFDAETPIIVLTGSPPDVMETIGSRAQDLIVKGSIDPRLLDRSLRYAVERAAMQRQLLHSQKMEVVGRFASSIVHDFNNLLTVIQGSVDLLEQRRRCTPDEVEDIEQIRGAADRAAGLTKQLLDYTRRDPTHVRTLNVGELIDDLSRLIGRLVGRHIEFTVDVPCDLWVVADRGQLEQVLVNLAANARDAMPDGGSLSIAASIRTQAELRMRLAHGRYVCLSVTDSGIGIPADILPRIFEPYFTTKGEDRGTGLGLASASTIVEKFGGRLTAESEPGRGSTFTVVLPESATRGEPRPVRLRADR